MKNYKKFTLTVPEIHHSIREVLAETQEEAEKLVMAGAYWGDGIHYCSSLYPINCITSDTTPEEIEAWEFERAILVDEILNQTGDESGKDQD